MLIVTELVKKFHYSVHKGPPLVCVLSQINLVPSLRSILVLFFQLRLGLPSGLFGSRFPNKILYISLLSYAYYMPCQSHPS